MLKKYNQELIKVLVNISNEKLMQVFLADLLSAKELDDIVMRWQIVKQLAKNIPQREIAKNLGVSIAKITRGSRALQNKNSGFRKILN